MGPGQNVVLEGAADEDGGLREEAEGLCDNEADLFELGHVVIRRVPPPKHIVKLLLHLGLCLWVLRQQPSRPSEHAPRSLVASDEECDEVIPQLLLGGVCPPEVDEEPEEGGVCDIVIVLVEQGVEVSLLLLADNIQDELVQNAVEEVHVVLKLPLARHQRGDGPLGAEAGDLPVGEVEGRAVLRLPQGTKRSLHHGGELVNTPKVVVEDGLADDVERAGVPVLLHVDDLPAVGGLCKLVV
mmetsp:Transcript_491/g.1146  ORF Transcript_491/g.1146 Transcript_491/m.1146 type:complete len:241 (-) Transcript_491:819-1541(-)